MKIINKDLFIPLLINGFIREWSSFFRGVQIKLTFKLHLEIFFVLKEIIIIKGIKMADQLRDKIDIEGSKIENRLFIISSG